MTISKLATTLFFCLSSFAALGQDGICGSKICGMVSEKGHTGGLPGVTVMVISTGQVFSTDHDGLFSIKGICPGKHKIEFRLIGYTPIRTEVEAIGNKTEINIKLSEEHLQLNEVVVEGKKEDTEGGKSVNEISGQALEATRGGTLGETLKGVTGVSMLQTGSSISKPVIHGMHSNRVLILNNGVRQEGQQWGSEHAPEIDPFVANKISVVKGAAGVKYGADAIAGVILVEPNQLPDTKGVSGMIQSALSTNGRQGVLSGTMQGKTNGIGGMGWRVQGTSKRGGFINAPGYYMDNTAVGETNFSGAFGWEKKKWGFHSYYSRFYTRLGILSSAHIGNVTDLKDAIDRGEPLIRPEFSYGLNRPLQIIAHDLFKAKYYRRVKEWGKFNALYAYQINNRQEFDKHGFAPGQEKNFQKGELDFTLKAHSLDLTFEAVSKKHFGGEVGVSNMLKYNIYHGRPLIPNFLSYNIGLFALGHYSKEKIHLEAGVRGDYNYLATYVAKNGGVESHLFNFKNASATFGGTYSISKYLKIQSNLATAWRPPNVNELFSNGVHHGAASFEIGNKDLGSEVAYNSNLSLVRTGKHIAFELGGYYNYIKNYIYLNPVFPEVLTIRGAFPSFEYQQADAVFKGIDAQITWECTHWLELQNKASLISASFQSDKGQIPLTPSNRNDFTASFRLKDSGSLKNKALSVGNTFVAQKTGLKPNADYAPAPPAYALFSASLSVDKVFKNKNTVSFILQGSNLANTRYKEYMNRFRYYTYEQGRNITLKVKYSFE